MKVYLDTTYKRDEQTEKNYLRIYNTIEKLGYKHIFKGIVNHEPLKSASADNADRKEREMYVKMYKQRLEYLHQSDINVFEASLPSLSTGLLIEKSLDANKPTVVFYAEGNTPVLISGIEDDKLILISYTGKDLEQKVTETLKKANEIRDKRFNFFISPELLDYLERSSKIDGITKSTFIRRLILKHKKSTKS